MLAYTERIKVSRERDEYGLPGRPCGYILPWLARCLSFDAPHALSERSLTRAFQPKNSSYGILRSFPSHRTPSSIAGYLYGRAFIWTLTADKIQARFICVSYLRSITNTLHKCNILPRFSLQAQISQTHTYRRWLRVCQPAYIYTCRWRAEPSWGALL